ncbi:MAG: hypothetical protein ACPGD3_01990 [Luminiphilus sp.]|jgi:hypothetical protein
MKRAHLISAAITITVTVLSAYWLTRDHYEDPCTTTQDLTAAVIADEGVDQGSLVDNALIQRRDCNISEPTP